jgi:beta-galactosidase
MRKTSLALCIVVACGAIAQNINAQNINAQTPWYLDPTVVSIGKELPRGDVVSHDSKADAVLHTTGASRYLQPLEEWSRAETNDAVTFTTRFKIPFEWLDRRQFLHVGRASGSFTVSINDSIVAYSQTGSTPSEFDISTTSREGANSLAITIFKDPIARRVENSRQATAPRIEGEVYILSQPRVRVRDVAIDTRMEGSGGLLELGVILKSHQLNAHSYTVHWELLNPLGEIMAEGRRETRLDMRREDTVRFFANIPRVVPWSHENPRLYTLFIKTQNEGRFREYLAFRVGFRSFDLCTVEEAMEGSGGASEGSSGGTTLGLNGVALPLVMREFLPAGNDDAAWREQIAGLRAEGVNALMLRGAPPRREFFSLCDSLGVYVACRADIDTRLAGDSRRVGGNPSNDPAWSSAYIDRTMAMYHTSKNHPSVAMFSLAERSANGLNLYESYLALKQLERHRPVLYADGGGEWDSDFVDPLVESSNTEGAADSLRAGGNDGIGGGDGGSVDGGPFKIEAIDLAEGRFQIANTLKITPLTGEAIYRVAAGRRTVASGAVSIEALPGRSTEFTVPTDAIKPGKSFSVEVEIAVERADGNYLPASDPNLKLYRRLDLPLAPANRTVVASGEFKGRR